MNQDKKILSGIILVSLCLMILMPISGVQGSYGSSQVDGSLDDGYTMIFNASESGGEFNMYQRNTGNSYYFFLKSIGNLTFQEFYLEKEGMIINISSNTELPGIYKFVFDAGRYNLEFSISNYLVDSDFSFRINNQSYLFSINPFPEPEEPEETYGFGLTEFMELLGDLAFANGWLSVLFWVVAIVWLWRSMTRKIWILRKPGSLKGQDFGRWIKEESVVIKGSTDMRLWRHKFKTDAAKTVTVQYLYCKYNKEELLAKTQFKRINGFWLTLPYLRIGTLKLRPDQYFTEKKLAKTPANYFKRIIYYLLCWVPKLNDELYYQLKWIETDGFVKEIPYIYINYAEDRIIEVYESNFEEKIFNKEKQVEEWKPRKATLTKEELVLLHKKENVRKIVDGEKSLKIRSFDSIDEALADKFDREELMAIHRYKESVLDNKIQRLNQKLEDTINQLEVERRERTEEKQNLLNQIAEHTEYLDQNLSSYIAKAIGLKQIGLGSKDILEQTLGNALQDYLKHSDKIKKKQELEREADFKKMEEELERTKRELQKKTLNDIAAGDIEVEHSNSED